MNPSEMFQDKMRRWDLISQLLAEVYRQAQKSNDLSTDTITVTAPINLIKEFEVYRLAHPELKYVMNIDGTELILYKSVNGEKTEIDIITIIKDDEGELVFSAGDASSIAERLVSTI